MLGSRPCSKTSSGVRLNRFSFILVVVHDLHLLRPVVPDETNTPLLVDANAVLSGAISPQSLQPVSRRPAQVFEVHGVIQEHQLAACPHLDLGRERLRGPAAEDALGFTAAEGADHSGW